MSPVEIIDQTRAFWLARGKERAQFLRQSGLRFVKGKTKQGESFEAVVHQRNFAEMSRVASIEREEIPISVSHVHGQKIVLFQVEDCFRSFDLTQKTLALNTLLNRAANIYAGKTFLVINNCRNDNFAINAENMIREISGKNREEIIQAISKI